MSSYAHYVLLDTFPFESGIVLSDLEGSCSDLFPGLVSMHTFLHTVIFFHWIIWRSCFLVGQAFIHVLITNKLMLKHCWNSQHFPCIPSDYIQKEVIRHQTCFSVLPSMQVQMQDSFPFSESAFDASSEQSF